MGELSKHNRRRGWWTPSRSSVRGRCCVCLRRKLSACVYLHPGNHLPDLVEGSRSPGLCVFFVCWFIQGYAPTMERDRKQEEPHGPRVPMERDRNQEESITLVLRVRLCGVVALKEWRRVAVAGKIFPIRFVVPPRGSLGRVCWGARQKHTPNHPSKGGTCVALCLRNFIPLSALASVVLSKTIPLRILSVDNMQPHPAASPRMTDTGPRPSENQPGASHDRGRGWTSAKGWRMLLERLSCAR